MSRLKPGARLRPSRRRGDEGAVNALVSLFLSTFFVVGVLAFVVDVGNLYVEHAELQNGADAGALAAARLCARDDACTVEGILGVARTAAEENAGDGAASARLRCARTSVIDDDDCPLDETQLSRCVGPAGDGNFVEIRTRTSTADGQTLLPPVFGQALLGDSHQGAHAAACARATWGAPVRHPRVFGIGIAACAFERLTGTPPPAGPGFAPADQIEAGTPDPAHRATVRQGECANPGDPPAETGPGALAWLGPPDGDCFQAMDVGASLSGREISPGWTPGPCQGAEGAVPLSVFLSGNRNPLAVPVYDSVVPGDGGTHTYHVAGFAYFLPSGFRFGADASWEGDECGAPADTDPCVMGFFTKGAVLGTVGTGPDYGLRAIQLTG